MTFFNFFFKITRTRGHVAVKNNLFRIVCYDLCMKKKYFDLSWKFLKEYIGLDYDIVACHLSEFVLEEEDGLFYLAFWYPLVSGLERVIVLVYDHEQVIADLSFMHASMDDVMKDKGVYDCITLESDWSNLEHFTLCNYMFDGYEYPYCGNDSFIGEALFFTNCYVTKVYRRRGIFFHMMDLSREVGLRMCEKNTILYSIVSLDPDIPCYGADTSEEPYFYSMKDEPTRLLNKEILEKRGYVSVRLEDDEENDGSKLWYAVLKHWIRIVDVQTC